MTQFLCRQHSLSILQDKANEEFVDVHKMKTEKDIELRAAEESLSGLKEVPFSHLTQMSACLYLRIHLWCFLYFWCISKLASLEICYRFKLNTGEMVKL